MEAMIRRALGGTFDAFAASSKNTISKQTALGRQLGARQASTAGVSTRAYAPWQQRTAQQSRSGTRGYSQFTSPLRWKSSPKRSFHTSKARKSPGAASGAKENIPEVSLSLSQRLKKLSREYGWSAVGVYLTFSILDFPFCFLLVRMVGVDKIAAVEHYVVSNVKQLIPENVREWWHDYRAQMKQASREKLGEEVTQNVEMAGWGVEEAEQKNKSQASESCRRCYHSYPLSDTLSK